MDSFNSLKLEIVRPGRRHGQLLSKLTNYVVLCEGTDADTVRVPFDHYELRADIRALRYYIAGEEGQQPIPSPTRADAVRRLSEQLEKVIEQMRNFQSRIAEASCACDLTHVRLILGGSELSLIPFELATAPAGWHGAGNKILLQTKSPVVFTREIRESERMPLEWNKRPRVLVCSASPDGFSLPPLKEHVAGILRALRPWIDGGSEKSRPLKPSDVVTVMEHASLESIEKEMSTEVYTHVHFICHGCALPGSEDRFGLALSEYGAPDKLKPVNGEMLANALHGGPGRRHTPTMVVLSCCDSANQSTVETPGSSIADHLHREGIPWVLASQLPLTYGGSATLANVWYHGIFSGDDPRVVLYQLRQELCKDAKNHDWASMVAYGAFPDNFEEQVRAFCIKQLRRLIESAFARAQRRREAGDPERCIEVEFEKIDNYLKKWKARLRKRKGRNDTEWGEYHGMEGAIAKQKAELRDKARAIELLETAADRYLEAAEAQIGNHWVIVQYLVLSRLINRKEKQENWFETALTSALLERDEPENRLWALGSLIELAILSENDNAGGKSTSQWAREFAKWVKKGSFELFSTRRQLNRYEAVWRKLFPKTVGKLKGRVDKALDCLPK
ncbi:MAG: CHAT domain-containing protein [Phycisphaerales bacterium]|nr:MAG: CHAT domain-containing protein [Phycisphaerales bacterium]